MAGKKISKGTFKTEIKKKKGFSKNKIVIILIAAAFAVFFIFNNFLKNDDPEVSYYKFKKEGELTFTDTTGKAITKIDIEIADNEYETQLGLMNRKGMEENQGMLFIFPTERLQSFWMLNTLFSLDMIFINKANEIVTIHKNTTPLSKQSYPSTAPAEYVLEVIAGFTDKFNVKEGDKVYWIGSNPNTPN